MQTRVGVVRRFDRSCLTDELLELHVESKQNIFFALRLQFEHVVLRDNDFLCSWHYTDLSI